MEVAYTVVETRRPALGNARREVAVSIHIEPLYLCIDIVVWMLMYHATYRIVGVMRDPSLVCWAVGPFGVTPISLREPSVKNRIAQFVLAAAIMMAAVYVSLFGVMRAPISGPDISGAMRLLVAVVPVVIATVIRLFLLALSRRYPLWGEARVLTRVQRSVALGARIYFTRRGRMFLRERFGATPHEFLRMVR